MPPGGLRAAAVRSPAAAVRGGRSRRRGGGARDPARGSAARARPGDRVRPLSARRPSRARARRPGRAPRARGAPRRGTAALAVGGLGRPAVPDVDHALRRRSPGGDQACACGPRLGAGPPAPRPAGRGASRPRRRRRRGAHVRLGSRRAIPRSSSPSCSARSCSAPMGGGSGRRGASTPRRRSRLPPSARSAGGSKPSRSTRACAVASGRPELLSARRCAARRARSGTPA